MSFLPLSLSWAAVSPPGLLYLLIGVISIFWLLAEKSHYVINISSIKLKEYQLSTVQVIKSIVAEDPVDWSEEPGIRPICLPDNTFVNFTQQARALVTGWGATRIEYEERMFYTRGNDVEGSLADTLNKLEDLRWSSHHRDPHVTLILQFTEPIWVY